MDVAITADRNVVQKKAEKSYKTIFFVEDIPLCCRNKIQSEKKNIYICVFKHNNVFIPLVATSFVHFDHPQTNATQNLKRLVTCSVHKFQVVWDPIYTNVKVC